MTRHDEETTRYVAPPEGFVCRECGDYREDEEPAFIVDDNPLCSGACYTLYFERFD